MHSLLRRVPRLQLLAVFESAARLGSFTEAARELGLTQPAVSRHIASLEQLTGLDLFHRSANRVELSAAGEELLSAVQGGLGRIDSRLRALTGNGTTFLLAANPGFAQQWLVPHLDRLQAALGDIDLRLRLFDRNSELEDQAFDAAIHLTSISGAPPGTRVLFPEVVVPVASPDLAAGLAADLALGGRQSAEALVQVPKLHLDGRDRHWLDWAEWFGAHDVAWPADEAEATRLSYNNYALVMNDALAGRGVALAWRGLVDDALATGALVAVGPEVHNPPNAYQLIPGSAAPIEVLDRVADWLAEIRRR